MQISALFKLIKVKVNQENLRVTNLDRKAENCWKYRISQSQAMPSESTSIFLEAPKAYRKHRQLNGNDLSLHNGG